MVSKPRLRFLSTAGSDEASENIQQISWSTDALQVEILVDSHRHVWFHSVRPAGTKIATYAAEIELSHALPLVQLRLRGEGSTSGTSERLVFSATSQRLVYDTHREWTDEGGVQCLEVCMSDPKTGLNITSKFRVFRGIPVLSSCATVTNEGTETVCLQTLASLSLGYLNRGHNQWWNEHDIVIANSTNFREAQWKTFDPADLGMDDCGASDFNLPGTRAHIVKSNLGTFSSCGSLPMGALTRRDGQQCYMWQIEHSGSWSWELGNILSGLYVIAGGPNEQHHRWTKALGPGQTFVGVSTALTVINGPIEAAFAPLTEYRRLIRRKHEDNELLPVIFNDFMNCLDGDPTEEKVMALIEPARKVGAEYFCIDAGWYDNGSGNDWWDTVGRWQPSTTRFPSGLKFVLDQIRSAGMKPGLWLEPEVMGVQSDAVGELPDDAYFQDQGQKVVVMGRYQLDFRHPAVISRLNGVVDSLVKNLGVEYFKFDYNIDVTQGTDVHASSSGDGMLEHRRAYMDWLNGIYDRFPALIIESCASGGQRLDWHTLATHSLQSTSDQTGPLYYPAISAGILTVLPPEQSASWAYPQPHYDDDLNALCMVNSMMGRLYISGRIDLLSARQLSLVVEACQVWKSIRMNIKTAVPVWPIGLHTWHQDWLVVGLQAEGVLYLAVWRRGGPENFNIPIPKDVAQGAKPEVKLMYPRSFNTGLVFECCNLSVTIPKFPSARLLSITC